MNLKNLLSLLIISLTCVVSTAQMCIIDVGNENSEQLKQVFQLNEAQIIALEEYKGQLNKEISTLQEQVQELIKSHPQSNPDELMIFAKKHKDLEDQMFNLIVVYDQKLISLFNDKQYERYILLCSKANRTAIERLQQ